MGLSEEGALTRQAAAELLFDCEECCLDPFFTRKVRSHFETAQCMLNSGKFDSLLRAWLNRGKITVAHIERTHAVNKHSFSGTHTHTLPADMQKARRIMLS